MTLSNFDWTDKTSVKWFILLPTGHEGPYSLETLIKKNPSREIKIWAEGLSEPVSFKVALARSEEVRPEMSEEDEIPPLPPLPQENEEPVPPLPEDEGPVQEEPLPASPVSSFKKIAIVSIIGLLLGAVGGREWVKSQEKFSINRAQRMSPEIFQRITQDHKFEGWDKKIFFKEYVPADMSNIWLVTSGFQNCKVEATFQSVQGKLLVTEDEEKISFKTSATLDDHIVEFSRFDFLSGNKIVPGLYEMDLRAFNCQWDGLAPRLGNLLRAPEPEYLTRMKVVLYHKGNVEFNDVLDKLIRKKLEQEIKNQNQEELFWQDLQQKLQTLHAVCLQIEQLLLDFTETPPRNFGSTLKVMVDKYTKNYGRFLTEFVVANEKYFLELENSELSNLSQKRTYETMVRMASKNIGFESMKIIEDLQKMKKPTKKDMEAVAARVKKTFLNQKDILNRKIIQLTEDRVK